MQGKPAARVSDPTACPVPGHGTSPIVSGSPDVFFDGLPVARQGDPSACGGALSGNLAPNVFINGLPVATLGSIRRLQGPASACPACWRPRRAMTPWCLWKAW